MRRRRRSRRRKRSRGGRQQASEVTGSARVGELPRLEGFGGEDQGLRLVSVRESVRLGGQGEAMTRRE